MDAQARVFEYEIAQLSERPVDAHTVYEKQRLYARVGQFLMGSFDGHWWCRYPSLMVFMMRLLELYPATESVRVLYDKMATQLGLCCKCVDLYHASLPGVRIELEYEFTAESVQAFFAKVAELDAERIHSAMALKAIDPTGALRANVATATRQQQTAITTALSTALYEMLSHRRLLSDFRCLRVLSQWLHKASPELRKLVDLNLLRDCSGVYQLLVSPDSSVRSFGMELVRHFGAIDLSTSDDDSSDSRSRTHAFVSVLDEWMFVLESASFNVLYLTLGLATTEELPLYLNPVVCIKTPTPQILWSALDTIMQQMDETSLEAMLESFETLPDLVFNYLHDADPASANQQLTFVICKCYAVMLRCLGHRFWRHTVHAPHVVFDLVLQQYIALPSWRVYVIKQFVELLPLLLASSRPPHVALQQSNRSKLAFYLQTRTRLVRFLIVDVCQLLHFSDSTLLVAAGKAVSTIICDCYDPRLQVAPSTIPQTTTRDDGALPEAQFIDYSVAASAFWWPCGRHDDSRSTGAGSLEELEPLWANYLFEILVNPQQPLSLIDHVATTSATILSKHVALARDQLFTLMLSSDDSITTTDKPIGTTLLERLCAWPAIPTIPVAVHGALFESFGIVSELLNIVDATPTKSIAVMSFAAVLQQCQTHLIAYFDRVCDEVLVKGLMNPLRFPVVAQHLMLCLLNPTAAIDQRMKRLLAHNAATKATSAKQPSVLEALLISVHRNTEAFLRGVLSLVQSLRLYDFHVVVTLPTLQKVVFLWTKVFEMLGTSLQKILADAVTAETTTATSQRLMTQSSRAATSVNLYKLPVLLNDLLVALFTALYAPSSSSSAITPLAVDDDALRVRLLDFGVTFWTFWTSTMHDTNAGTKRSAALIVPLTQCLLTSSPAQQPRAAELLMLVLETLLRANVALDDAILQAIERVQTIAPTIASKRSTDFARIIKKFRQYDRSTAFFSRKMVPQSALGEWKTKRKDALSTMQRKQLETIEQTTARRKSAASSFTPTTATRPMSGKAAARAQLRQTVDLTGVDDAYVDALARKNHSFYTEADTVGSVRQQQRTSTSSTLDKTNSRANKKSEFSISQVVQGLSHAHGTASSSCTRTTKASDERNAALRAKQHDKDQAAQAAAADAQADDAALQFAGLFHRIKHTQKPIPVCSLLPFYRQLLQLCMPQLLTRAFENERPDSKRALDAPALTFKKSSAYVQSFLPLLIEECSNELHDGLRKFVNRAGGHALRYESEKPREGMRCLQFTIVDVDESAVEQSFFFQRQQRFQHNRGTPKDKVFRNGDVVLLRHVASANGSDKTTATPLRSAARFMGGTREFLGVVLISDVEKGKKRVTMSATNNSNSNSNNKRDAAALEEDASSVKILFLNDIELDAATDDVRGFAVESMSANALSDSAWRVFCVANLTTSAREYISLRSVDLLPEHLRTTILTPSVFQSTQTELLMMTSKLDELRSEQTSSDAVAQVRALLQRLDSMDVTLMDLRSTSIGKAINKLRKHDDLDIKALATHLKTKWTQLMQLPDALERAPRFLAPALWDAIRVQYNQSQLQSVHSVLNNYNVGISLLQGPPGTGKTKTILALLSGFLALQPPAVAIVPTATATGTTPRTSHPSIATATAGVQSSDASSASASTTAPARPTFSLSAVASSRSSILRRSDASIPTATTHRTAIQALKNATTSVRSRLDDKLSGRKLSQAPSSLVVRQRVMSSSARSTTRRSNNVLLCAPSNGAVDELVLRIVTDGLLDATGAICKVRAPSIHPEALAEGWLSIVRLGNPGEDAPDSVKAVCLPQIIKRELEIHPKSLELRALQQTQQTLRKSIQDFHQRAKDAAAEAAALEATNDATEATARPPRRKGLAAIHQQLTKCSGEVRRLRDDVFALRTKMTAAILSRASIIACTLSKSGSGPLAGLQRGFDALIIDEAAQAVELSTLVPIRERVARVVLVGDPKQLPATVKSVVAATARYDRSLFERIAASGVAPSMLRVQYRMHPFLREFPSKQFYNNMLTDGASVMERVLRVCPTIYNMPCFQPFLLYDVSNSREEETGGTGSKSNRIEAHFCLELCASLFTIATDARKQNWSVGLVSPYKEQVRLLRRELANSRVPTGVSVEVNTVDGFQGREKDVIVFSCVRASTRGGIGFLRDVRRLNVAITRARFCLFVVGHVETLKRDPTWHALVQSANDRRLVVSTHGQSFADVARRLESKENAELVAHFYAMHDKVAKKQQPNGAAAVAVVESVTTEDVAAVASIAADSADGATTRDSKAVNVRVDDSVKTESVAVDVVKPEPLVATVSGKAEPMTTGKTPVTASRSFGSREGSRIVVAAAPTAVPTAPRHSDRDRPSHSRDRDRSRDRSRGRDRSSSRRTDRTDHRSSSTYKREHSKDRRSAERSKRPRPNNDEDHDGSKRDGRYAPSSSRQHSNTIATDSRYGSSSNGATTATLTASSTTSAPLRSISAKEFCLANEPVPRRSTGSNSAAAPPDSSSTTKRPRTAEQPRPAAMSLFPPSHKYYNRSLQSTVASNSTHQQQHQRSPRTTNSSSSSSTNSGGGVLGDILGSASQLASATSRVYDKPSDHRQ